jgi:hypothetical protein
LNEEERKKWIMETTFMALENVLQIVQSEKEEYDSLASGFLQRISEFRNSLLTGLGFMASVILGFAAVNVISAYVIESLMAIGAIGIGTYIVMNNLIFSISGRLTSISSAYYSCLNLVRISKSHMITLHAHSVDAPIAA